LAFCTALTLLIRVPVYVCRYALLRAPGFRPRGRADSGVTNAGESAFSNWNRYDTDITLTSDNATRGLVREPSGSRRCCGRSLTPPNAFTPRVREEVLELINASTLRPGDTSRFEPTQTAYAAQNRRDAARCTPNTAQGQNGKKGPSRGCWANCVNRMAWTKNHPD
jgi:hypothetical protein